MKKTLRITALLAAALLIMTGPLPARASQEYDLAGSVKLVFTDSGISATSGKGFKIEGTDLIISSSGTYVVSGSCADGTISVRKGTEGVTLVLEGLTLSSSDSAPVCCGKETHVKIIVSSGSVNTLGDSEYNNDEKYPENGRAENAVIKCKDGSSVILCGSGELNIVSRGKNGIRGGGDLYAEDSASEVVSPGSLTIQDLTLNVKACAGDGIKGNALLNILSGRITVSADDDGIKSEYTLNIGSAGTQGPVISVTDAVEGIEAAVINVYSGEVSVSASDDGINAANSDLENFSFEYNQYGGYVRVACSGGDAVDSNGTIGLYGGTIEAWARRAGPWRSGTARRRCCTPVRLPGT